jgi:hypothetical protein
MSRMSPPGLFLSVPAVLLSAAGAGGRRHPPPGGDRFDPIIHRQ